MNPNAEFDVIVYGATGYTGRLVAEYLNNAYGVDGRYKWAMAGRSADKLASVRDEIGVPASIDLIVADASDPASLKSMVERAKCVISTVGPYSLYGTPLVEACVEAGTDYVDLCGEPLWMADTISKFSDKAKQSGARIVHSCGFDSIPTDLGVWFLQEESKKAHGAPSERVRARVRGMQGSFSGGTAASLKATIAKVTEDPSLIGVLTNPFALCEGEQGVAQPDDSKPFEDETFGMWVAPFIMATINSKNIHRSNKLLGYPYGKEMAYDEMMFTGPGEDGKAAAEFVAKAGMGDDANRKPGEGPTKEERESGNFNFLIHGETKGGKVIKVGVTGDRDPGYGATSKMLAESALCLIEDRKDTAGGLWTPASAMGGALIPRLVQNAGMTFDVEN